MEALKGISSKKLEGAACAPPPKPFLFNVSGLRGAVRRAIVDALLESYPPLVRRVRSLTTTAGPCVETGSACRRVSREDFERITATGRWFVWGPGDEDAVQVTSVDELEERGRDGWVCVHETYPSPQGAGELRRVFGSKVFSVAVVPVDEENTLSGTGAHLDPEAQALRYMTENPSILTPEGEMRVFDLHLVSEDPKASVRKVMQVFESKFLDY